jgi:hypothetical protein
VRLAATRDNATPLKDFCGAALAVAAGLAMVGVNAVWSTAFPDAEHAKIRLGVVVERRNRIVHHCDYDPAVPGSVVPSLRAMHSMHSRSSATR